MYSNNYFSKSNKYSYYVKYRKLHNKLLGIVSENPQKFGMTPHILSAEIPKNCIISFKQIYFP